MADGPAKLPKLLTGLTARVTLGVTSILTMATQYSQSTKNLPPVSYIKSLDIWMITCMVYVFAALLEFAIVYHVHNTSLISLHGPLSPTQSATAQNGRSRGSTTVVALGSSEIHGNIFQRLKK